MPSPPLPRLTKLDPASAVLEATGRDSLVIKAGTIFNGEKLAAEAPFIVIGSGSSGSALVPGSDYFVVVRDGRVGIELATRAPDDPAILGGFHYAPGGNATARAGGDDIPAINPYSLWDINFRAACPDPRASLFGGSWVDDAGAGSRGAILFWSGYSFEHLGARGRGDHLRLD